MYFSQHCVRNFEIDTNLITLWSLNYLLFFNILLLNLTLMETYEKQIESEQVTTYFFFLPQRCFIK